MNKLNQNTCLIVNTHSSNEECLQLYFNQISKYFDEIQNIYVFSDIKPNIKTDKLFKFIIYDNQKSFREQFLYCISKIPFKYVIYTNEDYILYNKVNIEKLELFISTLENDSTIQYVRLMKGIDNYNIVYSKENCLNLIPYYDDNIFSQVTTIWKTDILKQIYSSGPNLGIGINGDKSGHFESYGSKICCELKINGVYYYNGEKKRGMYHYDSDVFPHICSALVKGKWNLREYKEELMPLLNNIIIDAKGVY